VFVTVTRRIILVIALLVFVLMGLFGGGEEPADATLIEMLRDAARREPLSENASIMLTHAGSGFVLVPLALASAGWLAWSSRLRDAMLLLLITVGGRLMIEGMKIAVGRPRPELDSYPVYVTSLSFPSGHAGNAMLTFLALALVVPRRSRPALVGLGAAGGIAVGLTRPLLGVHWPSDVVGGWAFAVAWAIICLAIFKRDRTAA
jgi:membrane-associated phospholipid phosphatase